MKKKINTIFHQLKNKICKFDLGRQLHTFMSQRDNTTNRRQQFFFVGVKKKIKRWLARRELKLLKEIWNKIGLKAALCFLGSWLKWKCYVEQWSVNSSQLNHKTWAASILVAASKLNFWGSNFVVLCLSFSRSVDMIAWEWSHMLNKQPFKAKVKPVKIATRVHYYTQIYSLRKWCNWILD